MPLFERRTLVEVANALNVLPPNSNIAFSGVSTDTRTVRPGNLFVALIGDNFDGHDYLQQASDKEAVAAIVSRDVPCDMPVIKVNDTRLALGQLAKVYRRGFNRPVVGITGSNGKTTVKEMISAILRDNGVVLSTRGNFNNDIGLPLTLLRLEPSDQFAVIEMGANHPGEIDYLASIARPNVAVLTNAGEAHLEGFGSLEGVAKAKAEIFNYLGPDETAVINADDKFCAQWLAKARASKCLTFGLNNSDADVRASNIRFDRNGASFTMHTPEGDVEITMAIFGRHNVRNSLAAAAAAQALGIGLDSIANALHNFSNVDGRLKFRAGKKQSIVIDDAYNANPDSFKAAIDVLSSFGGKKILVMGDMRELGDSSIDAHHQIGIYARNAALDGFFAIGEFSKHATDSYGSPAMHFDDYADLSSTIINCLAEDVTVLVKGSRGMHMETVIKELLENDASTSNAARS